MKSGRIAPTGEGTDYEEVPDEVRDEFEKYMAAYEDAEPVVLRDVLAEGGYPLPDPAAVADAELPALITYLAEGLSLLRVFLEHTDHLSDRELYVQLYHDVLLDPVVIFPKDQRGALHLDLIGSGSDEDCKQWLQYYAERGSGTLGEGVRGCAPAENAAAV